MAKIIIAKGERILQELVVAKERITIGRGPQNDLVIHSPAVSAEHAVIVTIDEDSFLEDLNSTNGTQVNGQPVKKHFLQDNDVIELAQYSIRFIGHGDHVADRNEHACAAPGVQRMRKMTRSAISHSGAVLRVLNGANAGKVVNLAKPLTTLGRHETQIAVVCKQNQAYFLAHVEGDNYPLINGLPIGAEMVEIRNGDIIGVADAEMEFLSD